MSGMEELFRIEEKGAHALAAWGKALGAAALAALGLFLAIDAGDALGSATPSFALGQWADKALGREPEGVVEAKALLRFAAKESGVSAVAWTRVWAGDRLGGANGRFNPVTFKMTLGPGFAKAASYQQRWLVFHEAGHAAALSTGRSAPLPLPSWGLSKEAAEAMRGSIVYRQAFAESFADVFAAAMALRADARDPVARAEIRAALGARAASVSLAHDTQPALGLASRRLGELSTWRGPRLMALIDAIASEGAALTVGEWGAEREALCLGGWRGWSRWALDGAHEEASLPWAMAPADPPKPGEPMAEPMRELMALTPARGWRREALAQGEPAYKRAVDPHRSLPSHETGEASAWGRAAAGRAGRSPGLGARSLSWAFGALGSRESRPWGCAV